MNQSPQQEQTPDSKSSQHKEQFLKLLYDVESAKGKKYWNMLKKEEYDRIHDLVLRAVTGNLSSRERTSLSKKKEYFNLYQWLKKYTVIVSGDHSSLVYQKDIHRDGTIPALEEYKIVSYIERMFDDIHAEHKIDHPKGRTLSKRICNKYGKSIPEWVCKLFTDTCPICVSRLNKKKPPAGHRPILTHGFGARGQIDCIDFQSMPDGEFRYLLNYQDHGIKFVFSVPMTSKRSSAVAWALIEIFTIIGPPVILQSDNGKEFSGAASSMPGKHVHFADTDIDDIIVEIKKLWPECKMVRGSPRHSQSNGGVERMNCTVQRKLGAWMHENNSKHWSVGCKLVQWRINTQINRTIGNKTSYELVFGQKPRVGLSRLPLHKELIETIATEGNLNKVLGLSGTNVIDDSFGVAIDDGDVIPFEGQCLTLTHEDPQGVTNDDCDVEEASEIDDVVLVHQSPPADSNKTLAPATNFFFETPTNDRIDTILMNPKEALAYRKKLLQDSSTESLHSVLCDFRCTTCESAGCSDIKSVSVFDKESYHNMASGTVWWSFELLSCFAALIAHDVHHPHLMFISCLYPSSVGCQTKVKVPTEVQFLITIAHAKDHFVLLQFDICNKTVLVYDGLRYDIKTWDAHVHAVLKQVSDSLDVTDSSKWSVVHGPDMINNQIDIQQPDGWNCGPIAAVCLWALYDYDSCISAINGVPVSSYRSAVVSHLEHLIGKHQVNLSCRQRSVGNINVNDDHNYDAAPVNVYENNTGNTLEISPKRKALRDEAFESLKKAAIKMRIDAEKKEKPINIGDVVQFSIEDIDKNKTDPGTLTVVVIGIQYKESGPLYRVASSKGPLKEQMHRNKLTLVPSVTPKLMGLEEVLLGHSGMTEISVRQAIANTSIHGKQGMTRCDCRGACQSNRCSCYKAGLKCNSRCHKMNVKCKNCY